MYLVCVLLFFSCQVLECFFSDVDVVKLVFLVSLHIDEQQNKLAEPQLYLHEYTVCLIYHISGQ